MDEINEMKQLANKLIELNQQYDSFDDYILNCFDFYKNFSNESWRDEFEDIHSIEFFANGFINIRCGLDFNAGFDGEKDRNNLSDDIKDNITSYYVQMLKALLNSKDLDNIYLLHRICAFNGILGFFKNSDDKKKALDEINELNSEIFSDPVMKEKAKNYKVRDRKIKE